MQKIDQINDSPKLFATGLRKFAVVALSLVLGLGFSGTSYSDENAGAFSFAFAESGQNVSATEYVGSGQATHLGHYRSAGVLSGAAYSLKYTSPSGEEMDGTDTETAVWIEGSIVCLRLDGAFAGGTGRYANATGRFQGVIYYDLNDGAYQATGTGFMTLAPQNGVGARGGKRD